MKRFPTAVLSLILTAFAYFSGHDASYALDKPAKLSLSIERFWEAHRFGRATLSPDGAHVALPVTQLSIENNQETTFLWMIAADGGEPRRLTGPGLSPSDPAFSPDGMQVAFSSAGIDRTVSQIHVLDIRTGETNRVTQVPTGAFTPRWSPDGKSIYFTSLVWPDASMDEQEDRLQDRKQSKVNAHVYDDAPISYWDRYFDGREWHLFSVRLKDKSVTAVTLSSAIPLTRAEPLADAFDVSPGGGEVAYVGQVRRDGTRYDTDIILAHVCGCKKPVNITAENPAGDFQPRYSPNGEFLAFAQQKIVGFDGDRARLVVLDLNSGEQDAITENWDRAIDGLIWESNSLSLLGTIDDEAVSRVYKFDIQGGPPVALTKSDNFSGLVSRNGVLVGFRQSLAEFPTLVNIGSSVQKLSHFNDALERTTRWGRYESVKAPASNGAEMQMWVVYPPDFDESLQYPALMLFHGGGRRNSADNRMRLTWNAQVFASWGYVVIWHNFHGTTGFGQAYADAIFPDWMTLPYKDTLLAAQWLKKQPYIDPERLAAAGASYGGFLTTMLLGREHPFKTLVAHAPVYNQFTQVGADYGAHKERYFEHWEDPAAFMRNSPHSYAANFETPTLITHGQLDLIVPVNHSLELFNTLQKLNVESRFIYFPDEDHRILKPHNSIFWYASVRKWLAEYVSPGGKRH